MKLLLILLPAVVAGNCDSLTSQLKTQKYLTNFAVSAGDATGRKYTYEGGNVTMSSTLMMASASKFPAATAIAGVVAEGHLTFDTPVSKVFSWWSKDARDPRSAVTLRHLLSFTSGFYWKDASGVVPCLEGLGSITTSPEDCAKQIYQQAPFAFKAGSTFSYNSFHLQIAGAMAAKAAGTTVQGMLSKYLIDKLGMKNTKWLVGQNPYLAAGMQTTPDDYDTFLRAYLSYKHLPKAIADEMERDYLSAPYATNVANSSMGLVYELGHYSMCNYFECLEKLPFTSWNSACAKANIHMDAGLFGYYPLIDRANGEYMQIAMAVIVSLDSKNQPTTQSIALRRAAKPTLDHCLRGGADESAPPLVAATAEEARAGQQLEREGSLASSLDDVVAAGARLF
eukprot:g1896.t1